ncbi:bacterial peptide chain release factor 1 (bRF-1) [Desulfatibacillum alkenivorans DSM 16219]|jgi:peptide chain release factor 1|uniref:Peptide chain release factor 1 n=1 Tax=Desulfatibacillum alkenivorans DSM 16219 TaxID=1121393 RepID=A0A1M6C566_9BACT|nr:peptide chain release factor 1 [Desulfatibacillum alkenivorans]SHI56187.1 bacterial peptide chain release factor 1 (bRF-1) [Desulfatibacillum alkenivorans DSM 16219]
MLDRLEGVEQRFLEVESLLSDPKIVGDQKVYQKYVREHADLSKVVEAYREYKQVLEGLEESRELLKDPDPDIKDLAKEEIDRLDKEQVRLEDELKILLLPKDPNDDKNVILEIRAGTGGDEAGLFAADLFRMYSRFAESQGWKVETLSEHLTGVGGIKEIAAMVTGQGVYSAFKFESGTHRVQRVPVTEAQGRIHTSACTVAVLPEAEEVDIQIDPSEIRVDVYRSQGAGGQHVNTTDSAVRLTHLPTGVVVTCQDEKSQHKNKAKAMKVLRARLLDHAVQEQNASISAERKSQVGSGDRSERIRTYNYPQGRVTDHRIGLTLYKLESIMTGQIQEIVDALTTHYNAEALQEGGL